MNIESPKQKGEQWAMESATLGQLLKIKRAGSVKPALKKPEYNREELLSFVRETVDERYSNAYQFIEAYFPQVLDDKNKQTCTTSDLVEFFDDGARDMFIATTK